MDSALTSYPMPLATRKRALELGASFIEGDLARLRADIITMEQRLDESHGLSAPVSTSHEMDAMKAAEWASAITVLREMARQED